MTSYVNNSNLLPTLHRFRAMVAYWSNFCCRQEGHLFSAFVGMEIKSRIAKYRFKKLERNIPLSEQTMGRWVMGQWVKWVIFEWVTWVMGQCSLTHDPCTYFRIHSQTHLSLSEIKEQSIIEVAYTKFQAQFCMCNCVTLWHFCLITLG